ncbi:MAG: nicotinate-nucleotide--dimethylbenzimidazole phosphoribosyltransferase [Actinomycetota bacterium]|nr:nicotinate-nucleotide--dimethylbenzimidazole phosphoribosyltransferase [Actinomycetota bacterium]
MPDVPGRLLARTLAAIGPADPQATKAARLRQRHLTKPLGSLGVLEDLSVQLAGLAGSCPPPVPEPAAVAVFAADHGVAVHGISVWPQEVTVQMVANYLAGGAAVNVFARQAGAHLTVVDVGIAGPVADPPPGCPVPLLRRRVRPGTADLTTGPAMTRDEAVRSVETGITVAHELVDAGFRCLLTAEMGIGNTTTSAVLIAAFTGAGADAVTGRGGGLSTERRRHKVAVVRAALDRHRRDQNRTDQNRPGPADPLGVLADVGGLEHGALAGLVLGAAERRVPVILDGVIAGAAALVAAALAPDSMAACVAGHRSAEPGHAITLEHLGLSHPLVDLGLRLGEGTGALLALPLVQTACRALREMATFDSGGVSVRDESLADD